MKRSIHISLLSRMTALILLLTLVLSSLTGCSKSVTDGAESSEEDLRVVGKIGDYEVLYDEYRYVVLSCKDLLCDRYGDDIWNTAEGIETYSPMLEEMVAERITANYAVLILCDENGFKKALYDKDAVKYVNAQIEATIYDIAVAAGYRVELSQNGDGGLNYKYQKGDLDKAKDLFKKALNSSHLTERVMRLTLGVEFAFSKLSNILTADKNIIPHTAEDIERFMNSEEFICTKHVFIEKSEDKSDEEAKAIAEEVYQMYLDGSTMNSLIGSKYNMDISMPYEGYYFTHGEMEDNYEKAAFALGEGQVSEIVETDSGFYIIQRCSKNENYMLANLDTFASQIIYAHVNKMVRSRQNELTLEKNEFGSSLVLHEFSAN